MTWYWKLRAWWTGRKVAAVVDADRARKLAGKIATLEKKRRQSK